MSFWQSRDPSRTILYRPVAALSLTERYVQPRLFPQAYNSSGCVLCASHFVPEILTDGYRCRNAPDGRIHY